MLNWALSYTMSTLSFLYILLSLAFISLFCLFACFNFFLLTQQTLHQVYKSMNTLRYQFAHLEILLSEPTPVWTGCPLGPLHSHHPTTKGGPLPLHCFQSPVSRIKSFTLLIHSNSEGAHTPLSSQDKIQRRYQFLRLCMSENVFILPW